MAARGTGEDVRSESATAGSEVFLTESSVHGWFGGGAMRRGGEMAACRRGEKVGDGRAHCGVSTAARGHSDSGGQCCGASTTGRFRLRRVGEMARQQRCNDDRRMSDDKRAVACTTSHGAASKQDCGRCRARDGGDEGRVVQWSSAVPVVSVLGRLPWRPVLR
uniref:Uncharacterized protein n=1 Tax=Arundo donax TaxID=35708 RepID=A0A0A8ZDS6_ARUDO